MVYTSTDAYVRDDGVDDELMDILKAMRLYDSKHRSNRREHAPHSPMIETGSIKVIPGGDCLFQQCDSGSDVSCTSVPATDESLDLVPHQAIGNFDAEGSNACNAPPKAILPLERAASLPLLSCAPSWRRINKPRRASSDTHMPALSSSSSGRQRGVYRQPLCRNYFLNKQKADVERSVASEASQTVQSTNDWDEDSNTCSNGTDDDEALARRLQEVWNAEGATDTDFGSLAEASHSNMTMNPNLDPNGVADDDNGVTRSCAATLDSHVMQYEHTDGGESHRSHVKDGQLTGGNQGKLQGENSLPSARIGDFKDDDEGSEADADASNLANQHYHHSTIVDHTEQQQHDPFHARSPTSERQRLLREGLMVTAKSILSGQFHVVTCQGCHQQLRTPLDYPLVYCQGCGVVSPTGV